jgi:hypothetical protein
MTLVKIIFFKVYQVFELRLSNFQHFNVPQPLVPKSSADWANTCVKAKHIGSTCVCVIAAVNWDSGRVREGWTQCDQIGRIFIICDWWYQGPMLWSLFLQNCLLFESKTPIFSLQILLRICKKITTLVPERLKSQFWCLLANLQ